MSVPIVPDPRPLLTFIDAPPVALICVGVVFGVLLVVAFVGISEVVRSEKPARASTAKHRPTGIRRLDLLGPKATPHPPKHSADAIAETQVLAAHPSYRGPVDGVHTDRRPVTTGGAR